MRRLLFLCLTVMSLLLAGCSSGGKPLSRQDLSLAFSCRADVACRDGSFVCAVRRAGPDDASVEVLSGSGQGLKWYWSGDGFTQTYRGLSARSEACVLPDGAFPALLVEILDCAGKPGALAAEGGNTFSGNLRGCEFRLTANGTTGFPETLSAQDWNLKVVFHHPEAAKAQTVVPTDLR